MSWFNIYGLIAMVLIMIPNIVYSIKIKYSWAFHNKLLETLEQIGRYGCFCFMVFNIPYTYQSFIIENGLIIYLIVNALLIASYCISWIIFFSKISVVRQLLLSILPSIIFLFSGIMILSIPLLVFATIFAPTHIYISLKSIKR